MIGRKFSTDPWVIGIGVTVIGGLVLYYIFGVGKSTTPKEIKPTVVNESNATPLPTASAIIVLETVRALEPLETGKKIGELPNGVYFYDSPRAIEYEIEEPDDDFLNASSRDTKYSFEMQKVKNRYYLIGFISDEAYSKIGSISQDSIYTMLFPNIWGGATKPVAIPFDSIYTIKTRTLDLDASKSIDMFDIGFREVLEKPSIHKVEDL